MHMRARTHTHTHTHTHTPWKHLCSSVNRFFRASPWSSPGKRKSPVASDPVGLEARRRGSSFIHPAGWQPHRWDTHLLPLSSPLSLSSQCPRACRTRVERPGSIHPFGLGSRRTTLLPQRSSEGKGVGAGENRHNGRPHVAGAGSALRLRGASRPRSSHPPASAGSPRARSRGPAAASSRSRPQRHLAPGPPPPPPSQQLSAPDSHFRGKRRTPPRRGLGDGAGPRAHVTLRVRGRSCAPSSRDPATAEGPPGAILVQVLVGWSGPGSRGIDSFSGKALWRTQLAAERQGVIVPPFEKPSSCLVKRVESCFLTWMVGTRVFFYCYSLHKE